MALPTTTVEIIGCDDSYWCVYGEGQGEQGVTMAAEQVQGIFDAPVRQTWTASANQTGGTLKGMWHDYRDISLGFHVLRTSDDKMEDIESRFRMAFDFRLDQWDHDAHLAKIRFTTELSGVRELEVQLYEAPDFDMKLDPIRRQYGNPILPLRAGQPMWVGETDKTQTWSTAGSSGNGFVIARNPTNRPMLHKWVGTRGQWTLPDFSWSGKPGQRVPGVDKLSGRDDRSRTILMPTIGALEGGFTVDLDKMEIPVRDAHDTNLLGRMPVPGRFFSYVIPPYTPATQLPVSVVGAPAGGAMVQLIQPRLWTRPWGLEKGV
ncbi:hypothetical protein CH298_02630 [Rhodococcoides fascians]|uniref:hypothetical protein n=1 Tax=Rhodococcoides fascians TaxID=1828 RepID=UPI000B9BFBC3|nr:hypothetical protein [Rhodococcus fascians]OZF23081.1 hypothetical protein CH298_02630 [Rhodococcus fascians]OZF24795.1 hypothetical protein CH297_02630 [Rhodococcus fascians]OZF72390.1 hypothetical protein CH308_02635 [Rhodococcus fascians]OZF73688.1 hypothetical protein CH307_02630 [Rhodococcus fascians]